MHRIYSLDNTIFNELTNDSEYWLGFITADGCLTAGKLKFNLNIDDKNHLYKFTLFSKSSNPVNEYHNIKNNFGTHSLVNLTISDKILCNKIMEYGLCERKSTNEFIISEALANSKDFWRGVIDGDGTVGVKSQTNKDYNYPYITLGTNCYNLICRYCEFIDINLSIKNVNINVKNNIYNDFYSVSFKGLKALNIIKLLYNNSTTYLDRKYNKAIEIIDNFDKMQYGKMKRFTKNYNIKKQII